MPIPGFQDVMLQLAGNDHPTADAVDALADEFQLTAGLRHLR